jgi:hypothetical protein
MDEFIGDKPKEIRVIRQLKIIRRTPIEPSVLVSHRVKSEPVKFQRTVVWPSSSACLEASRMNGGALIDLFSRF